jgi:hypothetical protein
MSAWPRGIPTLDWNSSIPASRNVSLSDSRALAVRATIGVFTPMERNFLVAYKQVKKKSSSRKVKLGARSIATSRKVNPKVQNPKPRKSNPKSWNLGSQKVNP